MMLSETWFSDGRIDFEMQKYRLLAYLQEADKRFGETKLYPTLSDLVFHYQNLISFRETKQILQNGFPKALGGLDLKHAKPVYEQLVQDDETMQELEAIVDYGIRHLKPVLDTGAQIYEFVERTLRLQPVGLVPLYRNEGYVLLKRSAPSETRAYRYAVSIFEHGQARYRGLHLHYLNSWTQSITHTTERIKHELIRAQPDLPQPAVYAVETELDVPLDETLLPIAKRLLVRHLSGEEQAG
jgi:hypothetical protein